MRAELGSRVHLRSRVMALRRVVVALPLPVGTAGPVLGLSFGLVGPISLTLILHRWGAVGHVAEYTFLYLAVVVAAGALFGALAAAVGSLTSALLVDFFFLSPVGSFTLYSTAETINWVIFSLVCLAIGALTTALRRQYRQARHAAEELREANRHLAQAHQIKQRADRTAMELALTEAQLEAIRKTDAFRRDLLATVSHELRTPIGSLLGYSTALLRQEAPDGPRREYLQILASESRRLGRLVNDLLEISRLELGQAHVECEPINMTDAASEAGQRWSEQVSVHVSARPEPVIAHADWDRVQQIFDNLIRNAVEHARTPVEIDLGAIDARVLCQVSDHGPGIPPELRLDLFESYRKQPGGSGLGLGLAVSKGLVEAMGGSIWLEQGSQGGTTISFSLPQGSV